jgi:hypothetical protein
MALGFVWFHGHGYRSPPVTAQFREGDGEEKMARERERVSKVFSWLSQ